MNSVLTREITARKIPSRGPAFPFIQRLLNLNDIYDEEHPIEVVILSRNHADAVKCAPEF